MECRKDTKARLRDQSFRERHGVEIKNLRDVDLTDYVPRVLPCLQKRPTCPFSNMSPPLTSGIQRGADRLARLVQTQKNYLGAFGASPLIGWEYPVLFKFLKKARVTGSSWIILVSLIQDMEYVDREESAKAIEAQQERQKAKDRPRRRRA